MKNKQFTLNSSANLTGTLSGALKGPKGDKGDPGESGTSDYNLLENKPDLSVYALQKDLEALRAVVDGIASHVTTGSARVEYTVDSETITYALRSTVQETIIGGSYLPELSNGYNFIKLKLKDGNETTNLETPASVVDYITIYYPLETTYVKFANTRVKEVIEIMGNNINDARGMFYNCTSLVSANLSFLPASVSVDTTTFEGVNPEAQIKVQDGFDVENSGFAGTLIQPITGLYLSPDWLEITERGTRYRVEVIPNEPDRPMSLNVHSFEDSGYGAQYETFFDAGIPYFEVWYDGTGEFTIDMGVTDEISGYSRDISAFVRIAEEPAVEYITEFTLNCESLDIYRVGSGTSYCVYAYYNEKDRPVNFVVDYPDSTWSAINYISTNVDGEEGLFTYIKFELLYPCQPFSGTVTIRETYSGISKDITINVDSYVDLIVHYKATDGDYSEDNIVVGGNGPYYFVGEATGEDNYGRYTILGLRPFNTYPIQLTTNRPDNPMYQLSDTINPSSDQTEIWISDDSTEINYENPESGGGDEPDEPSEPEDDGLVEMVVHFRDPKNAYNEFYVEWSNPTYSYTTYDLSQAQEDEYGKYINIQISRGNDNTFEFKDTTGTYNMYSTGFNITTEESIWFDFAYNQYSMNTATDFSPVSGEQVTLDIVYIAYEGESVGLFTIQEGAYAKSIVASYNSDTNEYYVTIPVLVGPEIQIEVNNIWRANFYPLVDKSIWLLPFNQTIYEERPQSIPSYNPFNPTIHFHDPAGNYDYGYVCYIESAGSGNNLIFSGMKDDFGVYETTSGNITLYTGVDYNIQFYDQTTWNWEQISRPICFSSEVTDIWFILGDESIYFEKPEI